MSADGRTGIDTRKQAVSIRMSRSDIRHIKRLAERLGARDSDVIRFAIKLMLARLSPLQDPSVRGRGLVPVLLEASPDLLRHFDLDAARLASIINDGAEPERRVDADDIQLIAMSAVQRSYLRLRVAGLRRPPETERAAGGALDGAASGADEDALDHTLRQYLYEKYLFGKSTHSVNSQGGDP